MVTYEGEIKDELPHVTGTTTRKIKGDPEFDFGEVIADSVFTDGFAAGQG